ncbi:MAG: PAS domain S-box protein, partial [Gammaproteobacteria bacterium]|nr:PAS domain S-box protein [Gammaproteobacteria bacterium]
MPAVRSSKLVLADPITIVLGSLSLLLGLSCLLLWRSKKAEQRRLNSFHDEVVDVAGTSGFGKRVPVERASDDLAALGKVINQLFDAISDREKEAWARETLFQDLANSMPDVVIVHGNKIHYANTAATNLLGIDAKHLRGQPMIDLVRPAYRTRMRQNIAALVAGTSDSLTQELQLVDGHQGERWAESKSVAVSYRGKPAALTIARDVTYRKSVEAALDRGKHQAQITLESIGEGVVTTDTNGVIDYLNSAAQDLTGAAGEEALGQRLSDIVKLVDENDRRDLGDPVSQCLVNNKRISMGRRALLVSRIDEKELSVDVTASPITDLDGS